MSIDKQFLPNLYSAHHKHAKGQNYFLFKTCKIYFNSTALFEIKVRVLFSLEPS